ncbi:hypothetical protein [Bacteroides sp.]
MDILIFLIIVAVIAIFIIKEARKSETKSSGKPAPIPTAEQKNPIEITIPPKNKISPPPIPKAYASKRNVTPPCIHEQEEESDIAIRSAEDARKAIIWSEILNRKY